jgi:hypothetical protein
MRGWVLTTAGKAMIVYNLNGARVAEIVARGAPLDSDRSVSELIREARSSNAQWVVIPAERLSKDLFRLAEKTAAFIDKFVTHKLRLAILGDVEAPESVTDKCVFLRDCNDLRARLCPARQPH